MSTISRPYPQNHVLTVKQIRATEDLLSLTHEIRELWIIGPLTKPGAGDEEARRNMKQEAEETFNLVNALRNEQRLAQIGAAEQSPMRYHVKNLKAIPGERRQDRYLVCTSELLLLSAGILLFHFYSKGRLKLGVGKNNATCFIIDHAKIYF